MPQPTSNPLTGLAEAADGDEHDDEADAGWADLDFGADATEHTDLLQVPRKVEKITVSYSKASKQVSYAHLWAGTSTIMAHAAQSLSCGHKLSG